MASAIDDCPVLVSVKLGRQIYRPGRARVSCTLGVLGPGVSYDPTKPNNCGVNLENYGVAPDVWAVSMPEDELKAAVDEALRILAEGKWRFTTEDNQGGRGGRQTGNNLFVKHT